MTVRTALANSYNIPAVKLLDAVGVARMLESARAMGLRSLSQESTYYGLSLTLGGGEVTLLDLTTAFATLANEGTYVEPTPIRAIADALGRPVAGWQQSEPKQAVSAAAAYLVSDILSDNTARTPAFGANSPLKLSRPAAVKTGTTTDWRDNWTVGFTPSLVAGVWAGNSDGHPMKNTSGLTGAAPIWHDFMEAVLASPAMLATLDAPADAAAWQFDLPTDMERRADCPPGVTCREGGEFFSREWLDVAGEAGPLADSVALAPTAPVYADRGQGAPVDGLLPGGAGRACGRCSSFPANWVRLSRVSRLPRRTSHSGPASRHRLEPAAPHGGQSRPVRATRRAGGWSVGLGQTLRRADCTGIGGRGSCPGPQRRGHSRHHGCAGGRYPGGPSGPFRFGLAEPVTHHTSCPGQYSWDRCSTRPVLRWLACTS